LDGNNIFSFSSFSCTLNLCWRELTVRSANIHQTTFLTEKTSEIHDNSTVSEIPDNVSVISDELEEEEDVDDEDKSEQDHSFKVDFKVHWFLFLFLNCFRPFKFFTGLALIGFYLMYRVHFDWG
jgi:hypothetical protein